jgi:hypothetical protein
MQILHHNSILPLLVLSSVSEQYFCIVLATLYEYSIISFHFNL